MRGNHYIHLYVSLYVCVYVRVSLVTLYMQVTCKPLSGIVRQRYEQFVDKQCSESTLLDIISQVGIDMHGE